MGKSGHLADRGVFFQAKVEATNFLEALGYDSSMSESHFVDRDGAVGVISYVSYQGDTAQPYLTVVLFDEKVKSLPFLEVVGFEFQSPYVAFTNSHSWMWYKRNAESSDFVFLESPLNPPKPPASGKRLRPFQDKKEFKQFLQFMNNTLRDSMGGGIIERFDRISKILFTKVFDEREVMQKLKEAYDFRIETEDTAETLLARVKGVWQCTHLKHENLYEAKIPDFIEDHLALYKIVTNLQNISLLELLGILRV